MKEFEMSSVKRRQLGEAGFSLIELMIVVAIIGILATIAIPNFNRFQAKAKQSEAKGNLTGLYTAEKSFYAEWSQYFADFRDIGFAPEGKLTYMVGFPGAGNPAPLTPYNGPTLAGQQATQFDTVTASAGSPPAIHVLPVSGIPTSVAIAAAGPCVASAGPVLPAALGGVATFVAGAAGNLHAASTNNDLWTIDNNNLLCNNTDGTF
jgi:type IV pilus assembly protein PilA